jgi:ribosomal protein S18 acetylase RimI-like enzyme
MHLARIIVSPASRGGGLGRILCERLIERTNAVSEVRQLTLNVYRDNRQAMALYLSLGFTEIPGQSRQGLVAMHKTLR